MINGSFNQAETWKLIWYENHCTFRKIYMLIIKFIGNTETLIRHSNTVLVNMKGEDIGILQ